MMRLVRLPHKLYRSYVLYKAKLYRYRLRSSEATFFGESYPEKNWYYNYYYTKRSHLRSLSSRSAAPKKSPHKGICDKNCGLTRFIKTSNGRRKLVQLHNLAVDVLQCTPPLLDRYLPSVGPVVYLLLRLNRVFLLLHKLPKSRLFCCHVSVIEL